jgi:hypothetical protein
LLETPQGECVRRAKLPGVLRFYDALPLTPAWAGAVLASVLIAALLTSELALGRLTASPADLRIAILHCLLVAYFPAAYLYVIRWSRDTLIALGPALECSPQEIQRTSEAVGRYRWWGLGLAGLVMVVLAFSITIETTPDDFSPWSWSHMIPEVRWHRVLSPIIGWFVGCFIYAVIAESYRLSQLADRLAAIDLLDLGPLQPFTRQALRHALLILGGVSIYSLFLVETRYLGAVIEAWSAVVIVALVSFFLPIFGVHRRIRDAKRSELDWCRDALKRARITMKNGASDAARLPMDEAFAYMQLVERVREWPFDASTLRRFAVYLLIPLGSWSGGALIERAIDVLLD